MVTVERLPDEVVEFLGDRFVRLEIRRWTGCRFGDYLHNQADEEARAERMREAVRRARLLGKVRR